MTAILQTVFRHVLRSKMLVMLVVFSALVQYMGLWLLHSATLSLSVKMEGMVKVMEAPSAIGMGIMIQLFLGMFIAIFYGAWMLPYLHKGDRAGLTFVLPVSRWVYPAVYALVLLGLIALQYTAIFASVGSHFGFGYFTAEGVSWSGVLLSFLIQFLAFATVMFIVGISSLSIGPIATIFASSGVIVVLMVGKAILLMSDAEGGGSSVFNGILNVLPPIGDLVGDVIAAMDTQTVNWQRLALWVGWLALVVVGLRIRIRMPVLKRSADG